MNWKTLTEPHKIDELLRQSNHKTLVIFKHSTRCGISKMVLKEFEKQHTSKENIVDFYYIDLLNYRDVSNKIAQKLKIEHQSPQVIVLKNQEVIQHQSHYEILDLEIL